MQKVKNRVNLDQTLTFTQSSFAFMHPYQPRANPAAKLYNKVHSFFAIRSVENEFVDFRNYNLQTQFSEISQELFQAFRRNDKVVMQRSLSEGMFNHCVSLSKAGEQSPFLKQIDRFTRLQARVYAEADKLLPEEQWAQITVLLEGQDSQGQNVK
jgi:hypothetical protein